MNRADDGEGLSVSMVGSTPDPFLVGRDLETYELRALLDATVAGTGGCAVLTGPPGIGKSSLLRYASRQAARIGLKTAAGQARELDRLAPLGTLLSVLSHAGLADLEPAGPPGREETPFRHIDRIGAALETHTSVQPLLLIIDDAQWTDELSVLALRVLVPALSSSPLRWLLARRPVPTDSAAQAALDWLIGEGARELVLGPLDNDALGGLCAATLGATPDATVLALVDRGGGNPFLLEQLLLALRSAGQILIDDGTATVVGGELPAGFVAAVQQRLRGFAPESIRLLQAGAVLGRPFTVDTAARLLGRDPVDLVPAVEEVVAAGVMSERDADLRFGHDLLREAVYNGISSSVRSAMHRRAATVVRDDGRPALEAAEHLARSGAAGGREAVRTLRDAATEVAVRAPGTAADLIVRALSMLDPHDEARPELSADAVVLLASAGRLAEARALGETSLHSGLKPETKATLLLGLAEALKHAGQNRAAVAYSARALAIPAVSLPVQARLHAIQAHALLFVDGTTTVDNTASVDGTSGADLAGAEAERLGAECGEYGAAVFGSTARCMVAQAVGRLDDALDHARHAVELADRVGGEARHRHPRIWLGSALAAVDRFDEADRAYIEGRREAERLGTAWSHPLWHFYHACLMTSAGRLDEAVAEAEAGVRVAAQLTAWQLNVPLHGLLARLALLRGQRGTAREHVRALERLLASGITADPEEVTWTFAVVQQAEARPGPALTTLTPILDALPRRVLLYSNDPGAAAVLVQTALAAGDRSRAEVAATAAADLATRNPSVASLAGAAAHATGLLHADLGALREAVDHFRASPRRLARIAAMEDTAVAEHRAGNRAPAVELLEEALQEAAGCGAEQSVRRLRQRLTKLGTTGRMAGPDLPTSPLAGLTRAEQRVARLVAQGLTNREVAERLNLSPHTVDSHIRHAFTKLGINSRVELTLIVLAEDG